MRARRFDPVTVPAECGFRRVHRIECGRCGHADAVSANTISGSRSAEDLARIWARKGWTIGPNAARDVCPGCLEKARREKRKVAAMRKQEARNGESRDREGNQEAKRADGPTGNENQDPPRTMTRDERRLIFARLQDVFLDEARGYEAGWTDKRVAEDLGVPRAWVAAIREENFGPEGANEEIRALLSEAREVLAAAKAQVGVMEEAATTMGRMANDYSKALAKGHAARKQVVETARAEGRALTERVAGLEARARRIEEALR